MRLPAWSIVFLVSGLLPGCQCSHPASETTKGVSSVSDTSNGNTSSSYFQPDQIPGGDRVLSEAMHQNLVTNFKKHLFAQNDNNWVDYVDGYYKPMVDIYNRDTLLKAVETYAVKMGWYNRVRSQEIEKITPVEDMDSMWVVGIRAHILLEVELGDQFKEDPEQWLGAVKTKYPYAEYIPEKRLYRVDQDMKFYGLTRKDTLDFHFLTESFFSDPKLANLIDKDTFVKLRSRE